MTNDLRLSRRLCVVTHVCRANDGQGRVNYEVVKAALAAGWAVTFLGSELADDLRQQASLRWVRVAASRLPSNLLRYQVFAVKSAWWLRRHWGEFDVVLVNGFITWHRADVNAVHFVHAGWLNCGYFPYRIRQSPYGAYQKIYTLVNGFLERMAFRRAEWVIPVSQKIGAELLAVGVPAAVLRTIYNGVDLDEFCPGDGARGRFGLPEDVPLFLFAGDIRTSRKNLETVLRALALVPDVHLAVAGRLDGSPYPGLARELGVSGRVHFLGLVKDMPGLMRSVDLFVFPSRYEPMGLVLLEAMASGLPVITAATAGGAEIVGAGGRVLDDPDDAAGFAAVMREFGLDKGLCAQVGRAARRTAEFYSWGLMAEAYLSVFEDVRRAKQ